MHIRPDLKNLTLGQLTDYVQEQGLAPYRAGQIFAWLYRSGISDFSEMTDLAKKVRATLSERAFFTKITPAFREQSTDGTVKYGFRLGDGAVIETVLIPEDDHNTLCVSSQAGCAMGCRFCLTGAAGFKRNLTTAEIVNQVCAVRDELELQGNGRLNNLVFMGMGEPLANLDNLLPALDILTSTAGLDFSDRRITVSTCGLAPKIKVLGIKFNVNLAISLHAADDVTRSRLMPINDSYPIETLLAAARRFPMPKRRRIMIEYILIRDVNDSLEAARRLTGLLRDLRCKINLLPYNETPVLPFTRPSPERVEAFQDIIRNAGYTVIVRNSRGSDISAACGQLGYRSQKSEDEGRNKT